MHAAAGVVANTAPAFVGVAAPDIGKGPIGRSVVKRPVVSEFSGIETVVQGAISVHYQFFYFQIVLRNYIFRLDIQIVLAGSGQQEGED